MSTEPDRSKSLRGIAGMAIPAGLFISIGVGFLIDNVGAGTVLVLGAGFLLMIAMRIFFKES